MTPWRWRCCRRRGGADAPRRRWPPSRAPRNLDELKAVRLAHAGDRSPIAEANAEIGALPPAARAEAGRRVGAARAAINAAVASRQAELDRRAGPPGPGRGGRRRHAAVGPDAARRPAPGDVGRRAAGRRLHRDGLRDRGGPRGRGRVVQLRRAELPARPPGAGHAGHDLRRRAGRRAALRHGAAHPHLAGPDPGHADQAAAASTWSARASASAPTPSTPRTARCSTRSRRSPWTRG